MIQKNEYKDCPQHHHKLASGMPSYSSVQGRIVLGSSIHTMRERRTMLRKVLQQQIKVAERLTLSEGRYSRDASWAWDVVEEVSRKLHMIDTTIKTTILDGITHHNIDSAELDEDLPRRMYDV